MTGLGKSLTILGGTGFFGKSFLDAFRRGLLTPWRIDRVIAVARQPEALRAAAPELIGPGVELVGCDVATARDLPFGDYCIHAANTTDARRYADDPLAERAAILAAAENFVRCAAVAPATTRIVYASSGAVYGPQPAGVARTDETAPFADSGGLVSYKRDYAEAKLLAEAAVAGLGTRDGRLVAIARCFAFVGPYLPRDQHFAVGNFIADGLAGRAITVTARHPVIRSYMYADDLVRWLMTLAERATPDCRVYNVGSDAGVDVADLARRIATKFDVDINAGERAARPVDRYVPSTGRAARELGLTLGYDLDRALDATISRLTSDRLVRPGYSANSRSDAA